MCYSAPRSSFRNRSLAPLTLPALLIEPEPKLSPSSLTVPFPSVGNGVGADERINLDVNEEVDTFLSLIALLVLVLVLPPLAPLPKGNPRLVAKLLNGFGRPLVPVDVVLFLSCE